MEKGEVTNGEQLSVARRGRGDLNKNTRKDSNGPLGLGKGGGEEGGVTSGGSDLNNGGVVSDFLHKGQVRVVLTKQVRQASKIHHEMEIEGEDGEERARGLPIVSTATRHRGWSLRCAEKAGWGWSPKCAEEGEC